MEISKTCAKVSSAAKLRNNDFMDWPPALDYSHLVPQALLGLIGLFIMTQMVLGQLVRNSLPNETVSDVNTLLDGCTYPR